MAVKLIASDMDGTLLDENGQVPPETFDLILALRERGVRFVASSGRRWTRQNPYGPSPERKNRRGDRTGARSSRRNARRAPSGRG